MGPSPKGERCVLCSLRIAVGHDTAHCHCFLWAQKGLPVVSSIAGAGGAGREDKAAAQRFVWRTDSTGVQYSLAVR